MVNIKILRPTIFPNNVNSGITLTNSQLFPNGFSAYKLEHNTNEEVEQNKQILAYNIGCDVSKLVFQKQIHSDYIRIIKTLPTETEESDGLITNQSGIVLCVNLADCGGILCYDKITNCIGVFHSGWRGTTANIVPKGIALMQKEYGATPDNIMAYITPCAGAEKYEVGDDVAKYFPDNITPINNGKYLLDLKSAIFAQLQKSGISQIEMSAVCTISNINFHSFRRDGENSGRMTAFIGIL